MVIDAGKMCCFYEGNISFIFKITVWLTCGKTFIYLHVVCRS